MLSLGRRLSLSQIRSGCIGDAIRRGPGGRLCGPKARVLRENLWDDIGYIRVWCDACRSGGIDIGKHQSHYIARLHHLEDYSIFVCVTRDVAERVQRILTEIKHSALVIVANDVRGGLADPHEAVESVEACARLIV